MSRRILAQKPLALSLDEAIRLRDEAAAAGKILSVNQNMRYDQSMRVLKQILDRGELGDIVFAQIDMHAIPALAGLSRRLRPADARQYERASSRRAALPVRRSRRDHHADPQGPAHRFDHADGITVSTLRFPSGVLAVSLEDVWSGPREEGYDDDQHIGWRVEGTEGRRQGHDRLADRRGLDADLCLDDGQPAANG